MQHKYLLLLALLFIKISSFAQKRQLDSLYALLKDHPKQDEYHLQLLNSLSYWHSCRIPADAMKYADRAIALANKLHNRKQLVHAYNYKAANLLTVGERSASDSLLKKSLAISEAIRYREGIGECYLMMLPTHRTDMKLIQKTIALCRQNRNVPYEISAIMYLGGYYYGQNADSVKAYFRLVLEMSKKINDEVFIAGAYNCFAASSLYASDYDSAEIYCRLSDSIVVKNGNLALLENNYMLRGVMYGYKGDNIKELDCALKGLRIAEQRNSRENQAGLLINIGYFYGKLNKNQIAMPYLRKGVEMALAVKNINFAVGGYQEIALIHQKAERYDSAKALMETALRLSLDTKDTDRINHCYLIMGGLYEAIKDYSAALDWYQKSAILSKKIDSKYYYAQSLISSARVMNQMPYTPEQVTDMGNRALELAHQGGEIDLLRDAHLVLSEIFEKNGNTAKSLSHYKHYIVYKDSLLNAENAKSLNSLQLQYGTEKKEQEISLLKSQREVDKLYAARRRGINYGLGGALLGVMLVAFAFYYQNKKKRKLNAQLSIEKKKSDDLLLNILPSEVADELKERGATTAKQFDEVTVLFTDFVDFTIAGERMTPNELVDELHNCFKSFDEIISKHNIEKIKTIGDAYLAVCGLPNADIKHAANIVKAALEIRQFMSTRKQELGDKTFDIRIGIHSGPVVAGIVGVKKFAYDIWGDTVNTAARMEQNSEAGKINISETTYQLLMVSHTFGVCDTCHFEYRGEIEAKNKGAMKMYFVNVV